MASYCGITQTSRFAIEQQKAACELGRNARGLWCDDASAAVTFRNPTDGEPALRDRTRVQSYTVPNLESKRTKEAGNVRKHGIRSADAVSVLEDDQAITVSDDSVDEERWVTIGMDALGRILVVVYVWRGEKIRIISARRATARESRQYPENL